MLDHTAITHSKIPSPYESNGSGLAINDLDGDDDLDLVLANLGAPSNILWNEGGLRFRREQLNERAGNARTANIVDVDGDGWLDLVFTHRFDKPSYWRNSGQASGERFIAGTLPDVNNPFYSIDWADLDKDGDLDLIAGSYDTEISKQKGGIFDYQGGGVGIFVYTQEGGRFVAHRLSKEADALSIALPDLNQDGWLDILVGNDFNRPDAAWLHSHEGWQTTQPFKTTSENTMSLAVDDIDNDGTAEIFATDMKPYRKDVATLAAWLPVMDKMKRPPSISDPQWPENMLQIHSDAGQFQNHAYTRQIDATGWSWSSKFGDLDNDGFLDIYVVNGMIDDMLFAHLPNNELVEENFALHNDGTGNFRLAAEWGLGSTASGRGMSMADLDQDGDLDIVVNNLMSPAQLFENQLCAGQSIAIDLRWPTSKNPYALGATLSLQTSTGRYQRTVRAASGYLSGDPTRLHIGFPMGSILTSLSIRWPDGATSIIDTVKADTRLIVHRD